MEKPRVTNVDLQRRIDKLYRKNAKFGSGSTADAVRREAQSGQPVGGRYHTTKAKENLGGLTKWLENNKNDPSIKPQDLQTAQNLIRDLEKALSD